MIQKEELMIEFVQQNDHKLCCDIAILGMLLRGTNNPQFSPTMKMSNSPGIDCMPTQARM
jgi:hypothetical protein